MPTIEELEQQLKSLNEELMEGWKHFVLNDICSLITDGKHGDCENQENSGFYFLSAKDVLDGFLIYNGSRQITYSDFFETHRRTRLEPYDILLTNSGTIGRMAIARDLPQTSKTTFQKSVALLKPKKNIVNPFFLYYNLFSRRTELQNTAGGTTQQNLLLGDLKRFQILLPPLPLQRRIAEILGALDDKIELNSQMNQTLEEMAQALYKHYFVDDIDPENLPDGWVIATIENYLSTISKTHKFPNPDIIFLNTSDVYNGFVLHSNYSDVGTLPGQAKKSIRFGDILYSEIRPENRRFAYIDFEAEDYVVSTKLMVLRTKTDINSIFFYFLLTRPNIINDLQNQAEARSGTFPQITFDQIKEIQFILPTNKFLNSFIDGFLFPAYKMIFANNEENQQLISIRDTLLPRLISGEFIPSDLQTIESAL